MKPVTVLSFRRPPIDARLARSLMLLAVAIEGELEPFEYVSTRRNLTPPRPHLFLYRKTSWCH